MYLGPVEEEDVYNAHFMTTYPVKFMFFFKNPLYFWTFSRQTEYKVILSKGVSTKNCKFHYPLDMGSFMLGRDQISHKVKMRDYFNINFLYLRAGVRQISI